MIAEQLTPVRAASGADPYPYYAELVADRPLYFDEPLGMWVASSAEAVTAVLSAPELSVRPQDVPVPAALAGTPAGEVFGRLVRMTDGDFQLRAKPIVRAALSRADTVRAAELARERAASVLAEDPTQLSRLLFEVPASVVAQLLGLPADLDAAALTRAFVACIPASASAADAAAASPALQRLSVLLEPLLTERGTSLAGELTSAADTAGFDDVAALLANAIGLLSQTYDATAGLIGLTLLAAAAAEPGTPLDEAYLLEVARHDAPIQNTRRFAHADVELCGVQLAADDAVLVLLAAANRDPAANPEPAEFIPGREEPALFTYGVGVHGCPGQLLSVVIATAVVQTAAAIGGLPAHAGGYLPLANARIPEF